MDAFLKSSGHFPLFFHCSPGIASPLNNVSFSERNSMKSRAKAKLKIEFRKTRIWISKPGIEFQFSSRLTYDDMRAELKRVINERYFLLTMTSWAYLPPTKACNLGIAICKDCMHFIFLSLKTGNSTMTAIWSARPSGRLPTNWRPLATFTP